MSNERSGTKMSLMVRLFLGLLSVQILVACGGGNGSTPTGSTPAMGSSPPPTVPQSTAAGLSGRYVGTVKIGDVKYFGDALLTVDGLVRLYIAHHLGARSASAVRALHRSNRSRSRVRAAADRSALHALAKAH